jgi:hypothetical protein
MAWTELLFLHWRVPADRIARLLPEGLEVDTFDGSAWLGLVPFRMQRCWFRGFGWAPRDAGLTEFFECNLRTYARRRGVPGVWFLSLDAETLLPVLGGRWLWSLNYTHSRFNVSQEGLTTRYELSRRRGPWPAGRASVHWTRHERLPEARPGSLEHFLTERYWLFSHRRGQVLGGRVAHAPWPLHRAEVHHLDQTLTHAGGVPVEDEPLAWATPGVDVEGWRLGDPPDAA